MKEELTEDQQRARDIIAVLSAKPSEAPFPPPPPETPAEVRGDWSDVRSASQISSYLQCERKWAWAKIEGIRSEDTESSKKGTRCHSILEAYLKTAEWDFEERDLAEIVVAAAPYFPEPGECEAESEFWLKLSDPSRPEEKPFTFMGRIDASRTGEVYDLKTTKNLRWAKTDEDLQWDPQGILYSVADQCTHEGDATKLRWVYTQTQGANNAKPTDAWMMRPHAHLAASALVNVARKMREHVQTGKRALDLLPNVNACSAFGGCSYQANCNLSPGDRLRIQMQEKRKTMSIIEQLKSELGSTPIKAELTTKEEATKPAPADPINPPEKAKLENLYVSESDLPADEKPKKGGKKGAKAPKADDDFPKVTGKDGPYTPAAEAILTTANDIKKGVEVAADAIRKSGFTLYVDCFPLNQNVTLLESLIERAKEEVNKTLNVSDYRFVEYGKGAGALAQSLVEVLEAEMPSRVALSTRTPEGALAMNALIARASEVIRGVA